MKSGKQSVWDSYLTQQQISPQKRDISTRLSPPTPPTNRLLSMSYHSYSLQNTGSCRAVDEDKYQKPEPQKSTIEPAKPSVSESPCLVQDRARIAGTTESPLTACFSLGSLSNISDLDPSQAVVSDEVKPSSGAEDMIELFSAREPELPSTAASISRVNTALGEDPDNVTASRSSDCTFRGRSSGNSMMSSLSSSGCGEHCSTSLCCYSYHPCCIQYQL